jgi:hypothetical protein
MTIDYTATRCVPVFGARDAVTGWRDLTWDETSETIDPIKIIGRGMTGFHTPAGYTGRIDYLARCADPLYEGEHILWNGQRYHVEYVKLEWDGDNFLFRESALTYLPLYEATAAQAAWPATQVDARQKVKEYLDLRITAASLTKDDDVTLASTVNMFELGDFYHLRYEFRAATSPVQGIFAVGEPESEPLFAAGGSPWGYRENVPIHVLTVDSEDCRGDLLQRKMLNELRTVTETWEIGSHCALKSRRDMSRSLGSMRLFDIQWTLTYERSKA